MKAQQLYSHRSAIPNVFLFSLVSAFALMAGASRSTADPHNTCPVAITMAAAWSDSTGTCSFSATINGSIAKVGDYWESGAGTASVKYDYSNAGHDYTEAFDGPIPVDFYMEHLAAVPHPELKTDGIQFDAHVTQHPGRQLSEEVVQTEWDEGRGVGLSLDVSSPIGRVSWQAKDPRGGGAPQGARSQWWIREDIVDGVSKFLVSQGDTGNGDAIFVDPANGVIDNDVPNGSQDPTVTYTVTWAFDPDPEVIFAGPFPVVTVGLGAHRTSEKPVSIHQNRAIYPFRRIVVIYPQAKAGALTFDTSNSARATVREVSRQASPPNRAGEVEVILEVEGVTQTPVTSPDGDTDVRALYKGRTLETKKVLVVVPAAIHRPHPEFNGTATIASQALDAHTSPAIIDTPAGYKTMTYAYFTNLTITVDDQFGNTIHPIYAGAAVTEHGGIEMNQVLSPEGTYSDQVGVFHTVRDEPITDPLGNPNPRIQAFVSIPPPPNLWTIINQPNQKIFHQNVHVEVEGHMLDPAITDRLVYLTPPDHLMIIWP